MRYFEWTKHVRVRDEGDPNVYNLPCVYFRFVGFQTCGSIQTKLWTGVRRQKICGISNMQIYPDKIMDRYWTAKNQNYGLVLDAKKMSEQSTPNTGQNSHAKEKRNGTSSQTLNSNSCREALLLATDHDVESFQCSFHASTCLDSHQDHERFTWLRNSGSREQKRNKTVTH